MTELLADSDDPILPHFVRFMDEWAAEEEAQLQPAPQYSKNFIIALIVISAMITGLGLVFLFGTAKVVFSVHF